MTGFVLLRREHGREAERTEDERRAQAARVSAWVEIHRSVDGSRELLFHVHNASDTPIYEVELPLPTRDGSEPDAEFIGLVPPGQTVRRPAPRDWLSTYVGAEPVVIEFLDSSGWQWRRDEQGALVRSANRTTPELPKAARRRVVPTRRSSD
ncbi:hypothetical protein KDL01_27070 [Actinospica durhamensis]|uniref:Uncharacterized protein n=1 Tax=Actinospica durhamensis TaxID=1508375 RepID=A0A941IU60_9ACTN|nr:hypothetical protein [Actinospica durhamensis]MBR7836968.1 hypothetical protein [Actinospica durhamensis]